MTQRVVFSRPHDTEPEPESTPAGPPELMTHGAAALRARSHELPEGWEVQECADDDLLEEVSDEWDLPTRVAPAARMDALRDASREADDTPTAISLESASLAAPSEPEEVTAAYPAQTAMAAAALGHDEDDEFEETTSTYSRAHDSSAPPAEEANPAPPSPARQAHPRPDDIFTTTPPANDRATPAMDSDAALDPRWARAMSAGRRRLEAGQYRRATWSFHRACTFKPDDPAAHAGLGAAWLALGRPRKAAAAFQRAVNLSPNDESLQQRLNEACDQLMQSEKPLF